MTRKTTFCACCGKDVTHEFYPVQHVSLITFEEFDCCLDCAFESTEHRETVNELVDTGEWKNLEPWILDAVTVAIPPAGGLLPAMMMITGPTRMKLEDYAEMRAKTYQGTWGPDVEEDASFDGPLAYGPDDITQLHYPLPSDETIPDRVVACMMRVHDQIEQARKARLEADQRPHWIKRACKRAFSSAVSMIKKVLSRHAEPIRRPAGDSAGLLALGPPMASERA